jgi:hemoglobin-like flavoprotein
MTPTQVKLAQDSFAKLAIAGKLADLFYDRLFALAPELRSLFPGDLSGQKKMMMQMWTIGVNNLHRLQTIIPVVQELGRRHVGYGATEKHYESVGAAWLWAIEQGLGPDFNPSVMEAWTAVYLTFADVMQKAATEVNAPKKSHVVV